MPMKKKLNHQHFHVWQKRSKDMIDGPIKVTYFEITKNSFDCDRKYTCRNIQRNFPQNVVEVQEFLQIENILSTKGQSKLAVSDIENNVVIFTCNTIFQFLS